MVARNIFSREEPQAFIVKLCERHIANLLGKAALVQASRNRTFVSEGVPRAFSARTDADSSEHCMLGRKRSSNLGAVPGCARAFRPQGPVAVGKVGRGGVPRAVGNDLAHQAMRMPTWSPNCLGFDVSSVP